MQLTGCASIQFSLISHPAKNILNRFFPSHFIEHYWIISQKLTVKFMFVVFILCNKDLVVNALLLLPLIEV